MLDEETLPDGWGDSVALQSFLRLKKDVLGGSKRPEMGKIPILPSRYPSAPSLPL